MLGQWAHLTSVPLYRTSRKLSSLQVHARRRTRLFSILLLVATLLLLLPSSSVAENTSCPEEDADCVHYDNKSSNTNAHTNNPQQVVEKIHKKWQRRETHHTSSSVMIADDNTTLWAFPPSHRNEEDPVNLMIQYRPSITTNPGKRVLWKYEFACQSLPKMALSPTDGHVFALGCPSQQVRLHDGTTLTSKGGSVTIFQWNATPQKARIVQTIYGKNTTDQLGGQSLSLSAAGNTLAVVASSDSSNNDNMNNDNNRQQRRGTGYLDVYHYDASTTRASPSDNKPIKWQPLGQSITGISKAALSNDGTTIAAITKNKNLVVFTYQPEQEQWAKQDFASTWHNLRALSSSSLALAGNGKVLAVLQASRQGQSVNIYHRHKERQRQPGKADTKASSLRQVWKLDSSIPPPNASTNTGNTGTGRKIQRRQDKSSFGWVASLNHDGTRIAIGEPSYNNSRGIVYVYDYESLFQDWIPVGDPIVNSKKEQWGSFGRHLHLSQSGQHLIIKAMSYTSILELVTTTTTTTPPPPGKNDQQQAWKDEL